MKFINILYDALSDNATLDFRGTEYKKVLWDSKGYEWRLSGIIFKRFAVALNGGGFLNCKVWRRCLWKGDAVPLTTSGVFHFNASERKDILRKSAESKTDDLFNLWQEESTTERLQSSLRTSQEKEINLRRSAESMKKFRSSLTAGSRKPRYNKGTTKPSFKLIVDKNKKR